MTILNIIKSTFQKIIITLFAIGVIFTPSIAQAQSSCQIYNPGLSNFGPNCIPLLKGFQGNKAGISALILKVADYAIFIIGAISVLMIVYAGFLFITDGGGGENAIKGRKIIFNVIIGIVITIASYTIVSVVTGVISNLDISNIGSSSGGTLGI